MKKILFVIPTMRMGGAEKALVSLLKSLDPSQLDITLYLFETGGILQQEIPAYVRIIEADFITRGMLLEIRKYLWDVIKAGKFVAAYDRLKISLRARFNRRQFAWNSVKKHIRELEGHYDVAIGFLEGVTDFFVIDKVIADKKIGWIHTDMSKKVAIDIEKKYYLQFDKLVTITDSCKNAFIKMVPEAFGKMDVIKNIVINEEIREKADEKINFGWNENAINIVTIGRLEYQKGIDLGIRACNIIKKRGYNINWHVYGEGSLQAELSKMIQELHLSDTFILEGLVRNPYPYMKHAEMIVQPSRNEGKSIVLDEAKILDKAIVVTDYPSVNDQIEDGKTGLITDSTPEAIAEGIIRLLQNVGLREEIEKNCKNSFDQRKSPLEDFYRLIGIAERGDSVGL